MAPGRPRSSTATGASASSPPEDRLGLGSRTILAGVVIFGTVVIISQPFYGALSDRIGRKPLNIFSVLFAAAFAFPYFLLVNTGKPAIIYLAMVVATLFGARVRYTGFGSSRELSTALVGFSPFVAAFLADRMDGEPWLVAAYLMVTALISFVAFLFSAETKDVDITAFDPLEPEPGR